MVTPTLPVQSTCGPWATPTDITEGDVSGFNQATLTTCLQAASDLLFKLTALRYAGSCQDTVRPHSRMVAVDHGRPIAARGPYSGNWGMGYWGPGYLEGAGYSQWGWCTCNQEEQPGGTMLPSITLGVYPLTGIEQVLVDGVVQDPATYAIKDNIELIRLADPSQASYPNNNPGWPCCQRIDLPATQPGTWQVTFDYGTPPPPLGKMAAAELGYHFYLAVTPAAPGSCKLPARVTNIVRQGISAVLLDPQVFLSEGRTGLTICDYFIEQENPHGLRRRATVWTPDIGRRVTRLQ